MFCTTEIFFLEMTFDKVDMYLLSQLTNVFLKSDDVVYRTHLTS